MDLPVVPEYKRFFIYYLNIFSVYYGLSGVITVTNVFLDSTFYISNINVCIKFYL